MNTQIYSSETHRLHLRGRVIGSAVAGAALVLTAATALTIGRPAGPAAHSRTDDAAVSRAAAVERPQDSTIVFQPGTGAATRAGEPPVVFLVGSDEDREFIERFAAEAGYIRAQSGLAPITTSVMVVDSADEEARVGEQFAAIRDWQQSLGLPVTRVHDLRAR